MAKCCRCASSEVIREGRFGEGEEEKKDGCLSDESHSFPWREGAIYEEVKGNLKEKRGHCFFSPRFFCQQKCSRDLEFQLSSAQLVKELVMACDLSPSSQFASYLTRLPCTVTPKLRAAGTNALCCRHFKFGPAAWINLGARPDAGEIWMHCSIADLFALLIKHALNCNDACHLPLLRPCATGYPALTSTLSNHHHPIEGLSATGQSVPRAVIRNKYRAVIIHEILC